MAIAARSLSSVLLIGDSLVNGLARYHRVWSKYFEPLRALDFGVSGDRTQHVLWRTENGEIPLNLQIKAVTSCSTHKIDQQETDECTEHPRCTHDIPPMYRTTPHVLNSPNVLNIPRCTEYMSTLGGVQYIRGIP